MMMQTAMRQSLMGWQTKAVLGALGMVGPQLLHADSRRHLTTRLGERLQSLFLSHATTFGSLTPVTLGLFNFFERHVPKVGFFVPIGRASPLFKLDHHAELVHSVFGLQGDPQRMVGISDHEAAQLIATGKQSELMDRIYSAYAGYREDHDFVLVQGPSTQVGVTELDAQVAQALSTPVLLGVSGTDRMLPNDYYNMAMVKRQAFLDHHVEVAGVVLNQVPAKQHASLIPELKAKFEKEGLTFGGAIPTDRVLASVRLDEITQSLGCNVLFGKSANLDKEFSDIIVASQRVEELLEALESRGADGTPPLVVTSLDRIDVVLALLAAQVSVRGPTVSAVLLTNSGNAARGGRSYAHDILNRIFAGIETASASYKGAQLPVLYSDMPLYDVLGAIRKREHQPSMLPTSTSKIVQSKMLFDKYIDAQTVVHGVHTPSAGILTPKMFTHNLKTFCQKDPQRIVLPESADPRVLAAAAECQKRGLAKVTLLGKPETVLAEAKKLGLDLTGVSIHDIETSDRLDKYVDALVEARKKKALQRGVAMDMVKGDINMFGTMMVACGDADGMVSGAQHTTAATIRPGLQVLRATEKAVVSSVFFMCLPDKVLVYGDCAVNPNPTAEELAQIAYTSADTAAAFGLEPRVAMCSYSTLGSGAGPEVNKVVEAVKIVKERRPDIMVEGPIQYDAAIDPKVAAQKVKTKSEVAGKATVFIFPDLNTGNNTYKAVQQASGAIAMGPVMQGLTKPVNDLSRGCTIPDIVNTICVTSIQAMFQKRKEQSA